MVVQDIYKSSRPLDLRQYCRNLLAGSQVDSSRGRQLPTLALPTDEPVPLIAGAGVATSCVDADLGGVTVMRVGRTFIDVCKERRRTMFVFIIT